MHSTYKIEAVKTAPYNAADNNKTNHHTPPTGQIMSIEDRDYYREEVAKKTGSNQRGKATKPANSELLNSVINQTSQRPRKPRTATLFKRPMLLARRYEPAQQKQGMPKPLIALVWIFALAVLYGVFSLATRH